ncbi:hypothetical protein [Acinetobacter sp. SFA]|uniref:hypothetical protein n=1 Tax=Acinetobacter sp. SFA TaxID=1805633 RepID=UPI0007D045F4|nr:hypothetical protein [Acinetobacter sp. SFA]OAL80702.1 hypothetical protein AY607_03145 [Acinetobacter sp. SFA]
MSFGLKKGQKKPNQEGGKIQGPGTGTSDDVQKTVPDGTYIMPADSTAQIGEQNLEQLGQGKPLDVNVSNGEFEMTPEQVHAVGAQALDQMKDQTHTPSGLPQTIMDQPGEKPKLFFRDGGLVQNRYPSADEVRKAQLARQTQTAGQSQQPRLGPQMRDVTPEQRQLPATRTSQPQTSAPSTASPAASGSGFGIKAANMAKGLGKFHVAGAGIGGAAAGLNTSTEDYATRMGLDRNADRGPLAEAAIRTTGVLTDVGNAASFGLLGSRFADKQINQARADADANMADIAKRRAERDATRATPAPQQQAAATPAPSFNDQMNDAMYGAPASNQAPSGAANPYAIQQNGNSFSYANPGAASQARAAGIPELQASGINRQARDPEGVAKFMANTREMGPSEQQIQAAMGQQMNPQGFGLRYPDRPQMTDAQVNERRQLVRDISAPIKGARGMTTNQRAQLVELNQGDQNRAVQMYNTDANNMTSVQNNNTNNAASILQTGMREDGQNMRHGASLAQDGEQFNANFGLKAREQNLSEKKEGFGIRQAERVEKLNEMYDKAQTDEQRQSIQQRINRLTGAKEKEASNPYIKIKRDEVLDNKGNVIQPGGEVLFNYKTGQSIDPLTQTQSQGQSAQQFENYQVVQDANGNRAYVVNGEYVPIP